MFPDRQDYKRRHMGGLSKSILPGIYVYMFNLQALVIYRIRLIVNHDTDGQATRKIVRSTPLQR